MRYIRTKDGILKVFVTKISEPIYVEDRKCNMIGYWGYRMNDNAYVIGEIRESDFVKSADTIEELCDEFVGIDSQGHYIIHNDEFMEGARIVPLEEVKYYCAIWTDKGLIYVAKMNLNGELELL